MATYLTCNGSLTLVNYASKTGQNLDRFGANFINSECSTGWIISTVPDYGDLATVFILAASFFAFCAGWYIGLRQ